MTARFPAGLRDQIAAVCRRYPEKRAALLPVLDLIQREKGFVGPDDEREVAGILDLHPVAVREVLTFYSMFRRKPAGRRLLQVCTNLSCTLRGGLGLLAIIRERLGIEPGQTTEDGRFTLVEVECLGDCDKGPCLMIDDDLHDGLTAEKVEALLREAK